MDVLIKEYRLFSTGLQLSCHLVEQAELFLNEVAPVFVQHKSKINKLALFACTLFIAARETYSSSISKSSENDAPPEITVTQLLEKANISIMDFFSVTCFLKTNCQLSEKIKLNFIALERKYLIVSALYDKFESMVTEIFYSGSDVSPSPQNDKNVKTITVLKNHKILCWMLFLVAKAKVLWHRQELLATFHLLLCCIGEVIKITPSFLLLPPFDNITGKNDNSSSILEVLSIHFKTRFEEVREVRNGWLHVASELKTGSKLPEVEELQSIYSRLYIQNGDIDESLFLVGDWHLQPSSLEITSSPRKYQLMSVRRTLDTAEALNTILISAPDDLTQTLKLCLQKCAIDTSIIKEFLSQSKKTFIAEFGLAHEGSDKSLGERRFILAVRLYYIMLDAMLKKESERLPPQEFRSFLQNTVFHKSLLACCLEVILMSCGTIGSINFTPVPYGDNYQTQGISFPWILKVFDLEPFIFFKIIESFIRSAPTITLQIINHLKLIEDKIMDSLAWKSDSSIFGALEGNGCSPTCKVKYGSPQSSPGNWSPNKSKSQQSPRTPLRCHAVNIFLKKVCHLAYQRLEKMCHLLEIDQETISDIWSCVEHILYRKANLLQGRNLDQIIMCCIFAICKVQDKSVLFKTIIACYGQLPHSSVSVYKQVLTNDKKEFIVFFYNKEFNIAMGDYIISHFGNKKGVSSQSISSSPVVLSPLYSLPSKKNIFVSSLSQSPFKNPNEIIFRKPYTVGSLTQPSKMLQDINVSLNISPVTKNSLETKGKKRLNFDSESNPSAKRERSPSISSAKKFLDFN